MSVNLDTPPPKFFEDPAQINSRPGVAPIAAVLLVDRKDPAELLQAIPVQDRGKDSQLIARRNVQASQTMPSCNSPSPRTTNV